MGKRIRDYVKYTVSELENYIKTKETCVKKVRNRIHLNLPPYALINIKKTILQVIQTRKIGFFDPQLQGIILDVRNIKVLDSAAPIFFANPNIHLNIEADCYIFQPHVGAIVRGIVKHISYRQIGVIIYRVFSVSIRLERRANEALKLNSEIEFRIKRFDLQNVMPFIEGELVAKEVDGESSRVSSYVEESFTDGNTQNEEKIETIIGISSDSNEASETPNQKNNSKRIPRNKDGLDLLAERKAYLKSKDTTSKLKAADIQIISDNEDEAESSSTYSPAEKKNVNLTIKKEVKNTYLFHGNDQIKGEKTHSSDSESVDIFANQYSEEEDYKVDFVPEKTLPPRKLIEVSSAIHKLKRKETQKHVINYETQEHVLSDNQDLIEISPPTKVKLPVKRELEGRSNFSEERNNQLEIQLENNSGNEITQIEKRKSKKKKRKKSYDLDDSLMEIIKSVKNEKISSERDEANVIKNEPNETDTLNPRSKKSKTSVNVELSKVVVKAEREVRQDVRPSEDLAVHFNETSDASGSTRKKHKKIRNSQESEGSKLDTKKRREVQENKLGVLDCVVKNEELNAPIVSQHFGKSVNSKEKSSTDNLCNSLMEVEQINLIQHTSDIEEGKTPKRKKTKNKSTKSSDMLINLLDNVQKGKLKRSQSSDQDETVAPCMTQDTTINKKSKKEAKSKAHTKSTNNSFLNSPFVPGLSSTYVD